MQYLIILLSLFVQLAFSINGWSVEMADIPDGMVFIPDGSFIMGSSEKDGRIGFDIGVDELPRHEVYLKGFFIDKYEVTTSRYKKFLDATGHSPPYDPRFPDIYPWRDEGSVPEELADHPVIYVNWYDADAYCRWTGKRLPTEEEWEKAARGIDARMWPWGNKYDKNKANVEDINAGGTLPVGSFSDGVSPYGVYNMAGNVVEWTASWYKAYPGSKLKRRTFGKKFKVIRGGGWLLPGNPYSRTTNRSYASLPKKRHRSIGFRCAKDVGTE